LWQLKTEFAQLNIKVLVITFEPIRQQPVPAAKETMDFPYYVDEERKLYKYYGLSKAGFWDLWGFRTWVTYVHLLLKGWKMVKSTSDIYQRGGDVLIDPHGVIRLHHIGRGPADRPDPALIWRFVKDNAAK